MKRYVIPEGLHISHIFPSFCGKAPMINFEFRFSSGCLYNLDGNDNFDVNKLYGRSFGLIHNTTTLLGKLFRKKANSFRLGWNCEKQNGKIQLFAYYYNEGVRKIDYICDVSVNKIHTCFMYFDRISNKVCVDLSGQDVNLNTSYYFRFNDCRKWGLKLLPYFGGNMPAPNRMSVYINKLN